MKKYLASILGITVFIGFVSYATIQTKRSEEQNLLNQNSQISKEITIPENDSEILPNQLTDTIEPKLVKKTTQINLPIRPNIEIPPIVEAPVIIPADPIIIEQNVPVQKVNEDNYEREDEDYGYEEEEDD